MGKSLPSATKLQDFAKIVSPGRFQTPKRAKTISQIRVSAPETGKPGAVRLESERVKQQKLMESSQGQQSESRMPLGQVVSDCVKRWFQDALKEAKAGDSGMQVLVGQMYYSGYGVPRDPQKGRAWMNRASKTRVSVWNVAINTQVTMQVTQIRMNQRVMQNNVKCDLLLDLPVQNESLGCDDSGANQTSTTD